MISLEEITAEITKLEQQPATYATMEKLAWLHIVRDHMANAPASSSSEIPQGDSAFMKACAGKPIMKVMDLMDELMEALVIIQPRLYDAVMRKLD